MKGIILFIKNNLIKFVIIFVILIVFILWIIFYFIGEDKVENEKWVNISEFPNILEIDKEWKLLSYPEITVLSETDWEIMTINVVEWDIVDEWQSIMQIWSWDSDETIDTMEKQIWWKYEEYYELKDEYDQFELEHWKEISDLEKKLMEDNVALKIATDTDDKNTINKLKNEMQNLNKDLTLLKKQRDNLKSKLTSIDDNIQQINIESLNLYYEFDKQNPRSPFLWIIWNIYVNEWDQVNNWDKLFTVIDNTYSPEISVWLDFNEYLLTEDLTWVMIITENENRWDSYYEWEIYTRSPILNDEWKYTITVRILEDVSDLILSDKNTKITVVFTKDYTTIWIPYDCFTKIWENSWLLTLRDGDLITWMEVWIKNKWDDWINVDNLELFWLENEEEKDGMNLCIEDWNKIIKNWNNDPILHEDESLIEWRNHFDNVEDLCKEFIKVNPMYWSGRRNASIISLLWWSGEKIEVLCRLE